MCIININYIINLQGDEPNIKTEDIKNLNKLMYKNKSEIGTLATLIRDKNIGVQVFANLDNAELRHAILYKVFDLFLFDDNSRDWNNEIFDLYKKRSDNYKESYYDIFKDRDINSKKSLELKDYTGKFYNKMYGKIEVTLRSIKNKKSKKNYYLNLDVNGGIKNFDLEWWEKDTFITDKDEKWREKLLVDFNIDNDTVKSVKIYNVIFEKNM